MSLVMLWAGLVALIAKHAPVVKAGRPPLDLDMPVRSPSIQQWFGLGYAKFSNWV